MTKAEEQPLRWKVHPAKERLLPTCLTAMAILVFSMATGYGMRLEFEAAGLKAFLFGAAGSLMFFVVVLNRYFFSTEFTIDDEGITANYPLSKVRLDWKRVRRFLHDTKGGFLSTRAKSSFLDLFQGMPLTFSKNANEIVAQIEKRFQPEVSAK